MAYLNGFTRVNFKKDRQGNTVYFPWGGAGRGYRVPSAARALELRQFVFRSYLLSFGGIVGMQLLMGWPYMLAAAVVSTICLYYAIQGQIADMTPSEQYSRQRQ